MGNNKKLLELLNKEIEYLKEQEIKEEDRRKYLYEEKMEDIRDFFKGSYEIRQILRKLEKNKEFLIAIDNENIEIGEKYYLTKDIYFQCFYLHSEFDCYFYTEDYSWIYDNYIGSYSGINEWITNLVNEEYALFSGNSQYNYAFGSMDLKDFFRRIKDEKDEKTIEYRVDCLKKIIEFTKEDGKFSNIRKVVVDSIEYKLNKMKEEIKE